MHLTPNSRVVSLLKMLTYSAYAALLRRLTLVELLNFDKNRCEIPLLASGALGRDLLFLRRFIYFL